MFWMTIKQAELKYTLFCSQFSDVYSALFEIYHDLLEDFNFNFSQPKLIAISKI